MNPIVLNYVLLMAREILQDPRVAVLTILSAALRPVVSWRHDQFAAADPPLARESAR